jgi:DNA-binding transcriptional ArsR family regulator
MGNSSKTMRTAKTSAAIFAALGDETRLLLVSRLCDGRPMSIARLTSGTDITRQAVTKHLRVLERAGLLGRTRNGRMVVCKLAPESLNSAAAWIEKHRAIWDARFDARARYFEQSANQEPPTPAAGRKKRSIA